MEQGNWFVALPLAAADWLPARVPPPPEGTRAFAADDLHLTVAFLGAVGRDRAEAAWQAACAALRAGPSGAWVAAPFEVTLGGVVPMGPPRRATALAALVAEGGAALADAIEAARGAIWEAADARRDSRPAKPHLSLARIRRDATAEQRDAALAWAAALDLAGVRLHLDRLALYAWAADRRAVQFRILRVAAF